jgi:hypothetical protein
VAVTSDVQRAHRIVSTTSFLLAISTYTLLDEVVLKNSLHAKAKILVLILASIGAYAIFYSIFFSLLSTKLYRLVSPVAKLEGVWHQVFSIAGATGDGYRYGQVNVTARMDGIVFSGTNYRPDGSLSSSWQSSFVMTINQRIDVLYKSNGLKRGETSGIMQFMIEDRSVSRITGTFSDVNPGPNHGEIRLFRQSDEAAMFRSQIAGQPNA